MKYIVVGPKTEGLFNAFIPTGFVALGSRYADKVLTEGGIGLFSFSTIVKL